MIKMIRVGFYRGVWDPGSQEIFKTHRKSFLEHPYLRFSLNLLSKIPGNKNIFIRLFPASFIKYTFLYKFCHYHHFSSTQFQVKYPANPVSSHKAKILSHPDITVPIYVFHQSQSLL